MMSLEIGEILFLRVIGEIGKMSNLRFEQW